LARTLLGTEGAHPLVCVGINPSTAAPGDLDRTVATVARVAESGDFDGFMMLNVYPQRATNPNDMHTAADHELHAWNMHSIAAFADGRTLNVWAAWGTLIRQRKYLPQLLTDIVALAELANVQWLSRGPRSKAGHPHHQDSRHGVIIRERSERVLTSQGRCPGTGLVVSHVHTQP